jgi:hypothetical protein
MSMREIKKIVLFPSPFINPRHRSMESVDPQQLQPPLMLQLAVLPLLLGLLAL